jgi:hypothetical protein
MWMWRRVQQARINATGLCMCWVYMEYSDHLMQYNISKCNLENRYIHSPSYILYLYSASYIFRGKMSYILLLLYSQNITKYKNPVLVIKYKS